MTAEYKQWDPTKCIINVGGATGRAFADGEMITVEFAEDKRNMHVGADGHARHGKSANRSGTVTIRLASYSPTNAVFYALDEADVPFPITMVDKASNGDSFFAKSCMLRKMPNMVKGQEEAAREYVFQFTNGRVVPAGAEADGLLAAATGLIPGL